MKCKVAGAMTIAALVAFTAHAQDDSQAPDPKKVSYAFGMELAAQIKQMDAEVDVDTIVQAIKDVQNGRPTKLNPAELPALFQNEKNYARAKISAKDKTAGAAFLARNATNSGVTVLPDGLQYRVLQNGTGPTPKPDDMVVVKYRGTLVDGTEFDHNDRLEAGISAQINGWQEALPLMKVGSKWQIVLPPSLAYGRKWMRQIGPESTVIFEIELLSIAPASVPSDGPHVIPQ